MAEPRQRLCVVSPCYDEHETISRFYEALKHAVGAFPDLDHQIIFVDDGSEDGTLKALNAIFSFSVTPIRLATRLGLVMIATGACYLVYVLIENLFFQVKTKGWPSLMCTLLILGGLQLAVTGLIGEYLARVYSEVKGRPLYFFKQVLSLTDPSVRSLRP